MKRYFRFCAVCALSFLLTLTTAAQISSPDARYKADILLVIAHPDDDALVTPYLARAIFDQHKRVAVVFCTNGDSGSNSEGREHGRALGLEREIEARRALGRIGITNIWFLNGRDTATQDVLISLAVWPSASVLDQLVRIVRVTRPEVVLTWLPSSVAGENHGDHQASAVLATEAFDMAGDPTVFPSQLAVPIRQYESALEGLMPWQAKKLYYFTDAFNSDFFRGHGPEYDGKDISPAKHVSYLQLAAHSGAAYLTQMPDPALGRQVDAGDTSPAVLTKMQEAGFLFQPVRLWLAKSHVGGSVTGDVFEGISDTPIAFAPPPRPAAQPAPVEAKLGGFFGFYREFWRAHDLQSLESLRPEIAVQPRDTLTVPVVINNTSSAPVKVTVSAEAPAGWTLQSPATTVSVVPYEEQSVLMRVVSPAQLNGNFAEIRVQAQAGPKVLLKESVFAEVSAYVAGQVK